MEVMKLCCFVCVYIVSGSKSVCKRVSGEVVGWEDSGSGSDSWEVGSVKGAGCLGPTGR